MSPAPDGSIAETLAATARRWLPGGVNSPVRACRAVGETPLFVQRGEGPWLWDADGNRLLDLCCGWGALILGHAHPEVVEAVAAAARDGLSFGTCHRREGEMAERLCAAFPGAEQARLVNSGTEATMTALRLARWATGRNRIVKFAGGYHGHADALLVAAGSGCLDQPQASSPGVPPAAVADTLVLPYNDPAAVAAAFAQDPDGIAAVIVEPIAGNMGLVPATGEFLAAIRAATANHGALLIFDEVITGFRLAPGACPVPGGIRPDLSCLGKIIGGGLPIGAIVGPQSLLCGLAPAGPVYQAGTGSGNPVVVAAGLATLRRLVQDNPYPMLAARGQRLADKLGVAAKNAGMDIAVQVVGSMFTVFFRPGPPPSNMVEVQQSSIAAFAAWHRALRANGIFMPPSQFETAFLSTVHSEAEIDALAETMHREEGMPSLNEEPQHDMA
jgi:glutamate-1-semialdehyde 2,1-aminomutase